MPIPPSVSVSQTFPYPADNLSPYYSNSGFPFGTSFKYDFFPLVDNAPREVSADPPQIFIFSDAIVPTQAVARAGTGAVQTINAWTTVDVYRRSIAVAAIADPDPTSSIYKRIYWIAINFTLEASGQVQTVLRGLEMVRVTGHHKQINTDEFALAQILPSVTKYASTEQIAAAIAQAKTDVQAYLRAAGYEWSQIHRADRLNNSTAYRALVIIMLAQMQRPGDPFEYRAKAYEATYQAQIKSLQFEYDSNHDGNAETTDTKGGWGFVGR